MGVVRQVLACAILGFYIYHGIAQGVLKVLPGYPPKILVTETGRIIEQKEFNKFLSYVEDYAKEKN